MSPNPSVAKMVTQTIDVAKEARLRLRNVYNQLYKIKKTIPTHSITRRRPHPQKIVEKREIIIRQANIPSILTKSLISSTQRRKFTITSSSSSSSSIPKVIFESKKQSKDTKDLNSPDKNKESPKSTIWKKSMIALMFMAFGATALTVTAGSYDNIKNYITYECGFARSLIFWAKVFPVYLDYRFVKLGGQVKYSLLDFTTQHPNSPYTTLLKLLPIEYDDKDIIEQNLEEKYGKLHIKYADYALDIILLLRGYYIKLGQLGSLRGDFLPDLWVKRLETLHSDVPSISYDRVQNLISAALDQCYSESSTITPIYSQQEQQQEQRQKINDNTIIHRQLHPNCNPDCIHYTPIYDGTISSVFESINPIPLGSASIGQVHAAKLRGGADVVIKLQYPEVEKTFRADMHTVKQFCKLAQPEFLSFLDEIEKQFMTEFDYQKEAVNLDIASNNLKKSKLSSVAVIPKPVLPLCTKYMLVMEKLDATNMTQAIRTSFLEYATMKGLTLNEFMEKYRDASPPSSFKVRLQHIWSIFYITLANSSIFAYNKTIGWFKNSQYGYYDHIPYLLDLRWIIDTLFRLHADQIFQYGHLNGDPHPGNIMYLHDGRIGLIDFGQVKNLSLKQRALLARMYIALDDDDDESIALCFKAMGNVTKTNSVSGMKVYSTLNFDYDDDEMRGGVNVQEFFENLGKIDAMLVAAQHWVMPCRVSLMLRGFAYGVRYPVRTVPYWAPISREFFTNNPEMKLFVNEALEKVAIFEKNLQNSGLTHEEMTSERVKYIPNLVNMD